jgi:transcriptional regulator with XRE-family HTH domain
MKKIENSECQNGFGEFIKRGREARGLTQVEVATLLGISRSYYNYIELGSRNVDLVLAMKICRVLRIDLSDYIKDYL